MRLISLLVCFYLLSLILVSNSKTIEMGKKPMPIAHTQKTSNMKRTDGTEYLLKEIKLSDSENSTEFFYGAINMTGMYFGGIRIGDQSFSVLLDTGSSTLAVKKKKKTMKFFFHTKKKKYTKNYFK